MIPAFRGYRQVALKLEASLKLQSKTLFLKEGVKEGRGERKVRVL